MSNFSFIWGFIDKDRKYLSCTDSGAHWVSGARRVDIWYSKASVSSAIKFLIENAYFDVGGKLFQQKIGIPIGMDPAPFLANLFLAYYEIHWVKNLQKEQTMAEQENITTTLDLLMTEVLLMMVGNLKDLITRFIQKSCF